MMKTKHPTDAECKAALVAEMIGMAKAQFRELRRLPNDKVLLLLMQHVEAIQAKRRARRTRFARLKGRSDWDRQPVPVIEAQRRCGLFKWMQPDRYQAN